jgi:hypothetical protein
MATGKDQSGQPMSIRVAMKRRGILAAAGAVVAGIVAQKTAAPALAATFVTLANDVSSTLNNETISTYVHNTGANTFKHTDAAVLGESDNGPGVYGSVSFASTPQVPFSVGVYGDHGGTDGIGVHGVCAATNGTGVRGTASGTEGVGILAEIPSTTSAGNTSALQGINSSTGANGYGVYAKSARWHGVYAECGTDQGAGALVGVTNVSTGVAFQARANSPAIAAGFFVGNVSVFGALGVSGGKFAVVKGADGTYRGMYAVESPECWFEDVGMGKMVNGKAFITLDPLFAQHVHADTGYHVFITENDENNALHVTAKTVTGFTVQADDATLKAKGKSALQVNGTFSWRVMAKRNDIPGERMPVWEMPALTPIDPPKLPAPVPLVRKGSISSPQSAPPPRSAPSPVDVAPQGATQSPVQPAPPSR